MSISTKSELQALYQNWSTPVLQKAVDEQHGEYREQAIALMLDELARRGIERKLQAPSRKLDPILPPCDFERKKKLAEYTIIQPIPVVYEWEIKPPSPPDSSGCADH